METGRGQQYVELFGGSGNSVLDFITVSGEKFKHPLTDNSLRKRSEITKHREKVNLYCLFEHGCFSKILRKTAKTGHLMDAA